MIRQGVIDDARIIAEMAVKMWDEHTVAELAADFEALLKSPGCAVFLSMEGETPVGFAQCQLRHDYVEGTQSSPVGYLEGVFVEEPHRRKGHARALLAACEDWARAQGCCEFASDCELENAESFALHIKLGFAEANRVICFAKRL